MKKIKNIVVAAFSLCLLNSCSFLDLTPNVICSETFYTTENEVKYGLAGVYGVINNEEFYGSYYSIMISNTDDLCFFNRPTTTSYLQVYRHDATSTEVYKAWTSIYHGIRNANAFMEAVVDSEFDKEHLYYNEARFLRAYYHFILAQAWGDVPLRDAYVSNYSKTMCAATPQYDVLKWVISEMDACLELAPEELDNAPSRVTKTAMQGILARVCLFTAGATVDRRGDDAKDYYKLAMDYAKSVIESGKHHLNKDYQQIFINMISDQYDREYYESMWEADFLGDRSSAEKWTNGRIGDILGLQSSGSSGYSEFKCNFAYGQYDGSLKLWDLYWQTDRTDDENALAGKVTDCRQEWNMPPYNYAGNTNYAPYGSPAGTPVGCKASIDKTPYVYNKVTTTDDPTAAPAIRNCGKFRREVEYEGVRDAKRLYTGINFPILRYSDVLLMYAEAVNEYNGAPTEEAYGYVKDVRDRAGIATRPFTDYEEYSEFQSLVRNERGRELCFEGIRKWDLIRWGIFYDAMHEYTKYSTDERWAANVKATYARNIGAAVQQKHIVLPVPSVELGVNTKLVQNPLW